MKRLNFIVILLALLAILPLQAETYTAVSGTPYLFTANDNYDYWDMGLRLNSSPGYYIKRKSSSTENRFRFQVDVEAITDYLTNEEPSFFTTGGQIQVAIHSYLGPCETCYSFPTQDLNDYDGYVCDLTDFLTRPYFGYIGIDARWNYGATSEQITSTTGTLLRVFVKGVAPGPDADGLSEGDPDIKFIIPNYRSGGGYSGSPITFYGDYIQFRPVVTGCDTDNMRYLYFVERMRAADTDYSQRTHNHIYFNGSSDEQAARDQATWAKLDTCSGSTYCDFDYTGQWANQARLASTYDNPTLTYRFWSVSQNHLETFLSDSLTPEANTEPADFDYDGDYGWPGCNSVALVDDDDDGVMDISGGSSTNSIVFMVLTKTGKVVARRIYIRYHPHFIRYDFPVGWTPDNTQRECGYYVGSGASNYYFDEVDLNRLYADSTTTTPEDTTESEPDPPDNLDYSLTIDAAATPLATRIESPFWAGWHTSKFWKLENEAASKEALQTLAGLGEKWRAYQWLRPNNILTDGDWYMNSNGGMFYSGGSYYYDRVNTVCDLMVNNGIKPVIALTYMPSAINPDDCDSCHVAYDEAYGCLPANWNEWDDVIEALVDHLDGRYDLSDWRFQVWNEANHSIFHTGWGIEKYLEMWDHTTAAIKAVDPSIFVEGPDYSAVATYHGDFVNYTTNGSGEPVDGYTVHWYDYNPLVINRYYQKAINYVYQLIGPAAEQNYTYGISETNASWQRHATPQNVSRYQAAWFLGLYDALLCSADEYGEHMLPSYVMYCNHLGTDFNERALVENINGYNYLTAPVNANQMMAKLSSDRLAVSGCAWPEDAIDRWEWTKPEFNQLRAICTRSDTSLEVIVYHFDQTDRLHENYPDGDVSSMWTSDCDPYSAYPDSVAFQVEISDFPFATCHKRVFKINRYLSDITSWVADHGYPSDYATLAGHDTLACVYDDTVATASTVTLTDYIHTNAATMYVFETTSSDVPAVEGEITTTTPGPFAFGTSWQDTVWLFAENLDSTATWSVTEKPEWLSVSASGDTLADGDSTYIIIEGDSTYSGYDSDYLRIGSNYNNLSFVTTLSNLIPQSNYRVNCGGSAYTAQNDSVWSADQEWSDAVLFGYDGGTAWSGGSSIANTDDDTLYISERHSMSAYRFRVPADTFSVVLHFSENWFSVAGARVFSVAIEGQTVLEEFDIIDTAGAQFTAVTDTFEVACSDGVLDVTFASMIQNPKVNAVEISPVVTATPTAPVETGSGRVIFGGIE